MARRLHTVLGQLLEEVSFTASEVVVEASNMNLDEVLLLLSSHQRLSDDQAQEAVQEILRNLRSEEAELDWDDAWDTLDHIGPEHEKMIPSLIEWLQYGGKQAFDDHNARIWAIRALGQIGYLSESEAFLGNLRHGKNPEIKNEAHKALKRLMKRNSRIAQFGV